MRAAFVSSNELRLIVARFLVLTGVLLGFVSILASSAWAVGSCPNEQLRSENNSTQLPDCRAYEMVSPAYTAGFNIKEPFAEAHATSISGAGSLFGADVFVGQSFGVFAGAEGTEGFGVRYMFARTVSGWTTTPLEPSFTQFPNNANGGEPVMGSDLHASIWDLGAATEGSTLTPNRSFYLRDATSAYTVIGPDALPGTRGIDFVPVVKPEMRGASSDLSHLLFVSTDELEGEPFWPGDSTIAGQGRPSLYEYVGTHNSAPTPVSVKGGRGSHELISQCGSSLGGDIKPDGTPPQIASVYGAVSVTGTTVFFTVAHGGCEGYNPQTKTEEEGKGPAVSEIYARLDGERTVAISEPSTGLKGDCEVCQEGSPATATFKAASTDGTKVLFTTEQELLPENPGNTLYEYDFHAPEGHKIIAISHLASGAGVQGPATVSPDLSHVYFVATGVLTGSEENVEGHKAEAGKDNLYVYEPDPAHPGQSKTVFIATLSAADSSDWEGFEVQDNNVVQTTPDGRFLLFNSAAHLTPDDTSTAAQLFQYDSQTGGLVRVSVGENGYNNNGNANVAVGTGARQSTDGAYVFFDSTVPLSLRAAASVGFNNVYEYHDGNVYLISDGRDTSGFDTIHGSQLEGMSPSGTDVYFTTGDPLVSSDTNTQVGVYDARKEGGFPQSITARTCGEGACQGEQSRAPAAQSPASASTSGAGNLIPPAPTPIVVKKTTKKTTIKCAKGKKPNHGKCGKSKKKPRARKTTKRVGSTNRRVK